jgi:catechol 2,3-dioxygenase-like lactoylglutathione lyase family enzyme
MYNDGMSMKSVSGLVCYAKDVMKTADFYETLGFIVQDRSPEHASVRLNWFWIDFLAADKEDKSEFLEEARQMPRGGGQYTYIKVDDIDGFYQQITARGLQPSSEPRDWPWGNREFALRDPDGYKLVFFQKL